MDLKRAIFNAYLTAQQREWETIYLMVDAHDTLCGSNYKDTEEAFFPNALEALRKISAFPEVFLVLWTSCYPKDGPRYLERLAAEGINFKALNETPVANTKTGDFTRKPYFSVLIDDKAGFDPSTWDEVYQAFNQARLVYQLRPT